MKFKVSKCPNDNVAQINRLVVADASLNNQHMTFDCPNGNRVTYTLVKDDTMLPGEIGLNAVQRNTLGVAFGHELDLWYETGVGMAGQVTIDVDFVKKSPNLRLTINTNDVGKTFVNTFVNSVMCVGKAIMFMIHGVALQATVTSMKKLESTETIESGICFPQTAVVVSAASNNNITLTGSARVINAVRNIFNLDWDFTKMGIGGLDKEFQTMFRRAFVSRTLPPETVKKMGIKHVRGILLYGPPGTGKTLMARQIGKMLHGREPKIVNGPEVLNKYVGESEQKIRNLFEDAEKEAKEHGAESGLHVIIFDEIDAICKSRGSSGGHASVNDSLVNQLLSKIDGVQSLDNVLIIGMTNRIDLLDEALLRPGRLELKIQVSLPDEEGRLQILRIHANGLSRNNMLDEEVDLAQLAGQTKNFSGAEIEGLVRCATSYATNRCMDPKTMAADEEKVNAICVTDDDFQLALTEIQPAFGVASKELDRCITNGIVEWGPSVTKFLSEAQLLLDLIHNSDRTSVLSLLIEGPAHSGKTALAAHLAKLSQLPFVKLVSSENMVGFSETAKLNTINRIFEDAYRSPCSVVIMDDLERLIDYCPLGERFSNVLLQQLMVLINKKGPKENNKLLVLCTSGNRFLMNRVGLADLFSKIMTVENTKTLAHVMYILNTMRHDTDAFTTAELTQIAAGLALEPFKSGFSVGVKKVYLCAEMAKQSKENRANEFLHLMSETNLKWDI